MVETVESDSTNSTVPRRGVSPELWRIPASGTPEGAELPAICQKVCHRTRRSTTCVNPFPTVLASSIRSAYNAHHKEDVPLFAVSKADALCLAVLLCLDLSVFGWLLNPHLQQRTEPVPNGTLSATDQDPDSTRLLAASSSASPVAETTEPDADEPDDKLWQRTYGDYVVKTVSGSVEEGEIILQVFKAGELVFSTNSHRFYDPETPATDPDPHDVPHPFTNITGNGIPDLVVAEWSGGAHCCMTYYVFELGEVFHQVATIEAEHGDASFDDLDGNNIPVVQMRDWHYAYELTSFAGSPAPAIILRYTDGKYEIASDLMFTDALTDEEFTGLVHNVQEAYKKSETEGDEIKSPGVWGSDASLWDSMLDLAYKGHLEQAMQLFDECWQTGWEDKDKALDQFWNLVGSSQYGRALVEAQGYVFPEADLGKEGASSRSGTVISN